MEINTRDFGMVQVEEDAIYSFPEGLYGFEDDKEFAVFHQNYEDISFLYLQSVKAVDPCFLVFEPWDLYENYAPEISKEDLKGLQVESEDDLIFLVIASVSTDAENLSVNLKSPVVLNPKTREGRQLILANKDYTIRYKPFEVDGEDGTSC